MNQRYGNFKTYTYILKAPASQRSLCNYSEGDGCHCCRSVLLPWRAQKSCDAPACVSICTAIGWPHANAWHFSYCQILHIFDLQCCIIGHQLNNYWVVIILNLSVQNCRNEIEGLVILAFAWSSTTMQIFSCSLKTYQSFFFF